MALRELRLPDVGEGVAEDELVTWHAAPGDEITKDQVLVEVGTDKALIDVSSPFDGTAEELLVKEGEAAPVGNVIITTQEDGGGEGTAEAADVDAEAAGSESAEGDDGASDDESDSDGHVFTPPSVYRLAREPDVDLDVTGGSDPSGHVTEGDVRATADDDGDEDDGPSSSRTVQTDGKSTTAKRDEGTSAFASSSIPAESVDREQTPATPAACVLAKGESVDIDAVPATEMRDGEAFVSPETAQGYTQAQRKAQAADTETMSAGADTETATAEVAVDAANEPIPPEASPGAGERVPHRGVRKTIGDQMQQSKYTTPHVTHCDEVDVAGPVEPRGQLKPVAEERGLQLTYMPFVMKAVVAVLKGFLYLNSQFGEEDEEIALRDGHNIGVAAVADVGLLAPVVYDADRKGMFELVDKIDEKVEKVRNHRITPEEIRDGTFTVTSVGDIGGEYATPIINCSEVAVLALGAIREESRVVDGEVAPRNVLTLSLSLSHRVVDDVQDARFTNRVKKLLEDLRLLMSE